VNLKFLAFNTEIVDLSAFVSDPLALLLEVKIGGTNIGRAMQFAEDGVRVPGRTIIMVLSDFEEGFSRNRVIEKARSLVQSGVKDERCWYVERNALFGCPLPKRSEEGREGV